MLIGDGGRTRVLLKIVAGNADYYTLVVDESVLGVAGIECLCSLNFLHYCLMLPNWPQGGVVSHTAPRLEEYWLSSVEIHLLTSYGNKIWW
jgi:hypothetical protein